MWEYIISLIVLILGYIFFSERSRAIRRNGERLPRPRGTLPFAGFGLWFLRPKYQLLDWLVKLQPGFGLETYELAIPTLPPAILINDPKVLEFVLKNHETFIKGNTFRKASWDLFGNGILNTDGELWRIQRKAGLRFFTNSNLMHFIDVVLPPLMRALHQKLEKAASNGCVIDLQEALLEVTTGLMGRVAYDMEMSTEMSFSKAFDYASSVTAARFTNPLWPFSELFISSRISRSLREVKEIGAAIVKRAVHRRDQENKSGHTNTTSKYLVDSLLDHIDDPQVVAEAATNYLSAGRDTTAQVMTWTVYYLLRTPDALRQVRTSIEAEFPEIRSRHHLCLTYDTVSGQHSLPLVQAAFAEALRLSPAVPLEMKETTTQITLPDGTYLPEGAVVVWMPYSLARSPAIWGNDAEKYDIHRWLEKQENGGYHVLSRSAYENPVFNAGPRMCIGKRMAEVSANRILADLLWYWDFEEIRGAGERNGRRVLAESLTNPMEGGLPVTVRRRQYQRTGKVSRNS
ncbi:MAG: hypothetical protein GOMPHAMPRED_004220 [Gomphillus americanus]|uniref:Cytochrome P450 n=1 Tax=Gomphillus americanus TaxID=1940652 RepID=A0A8H3IG48_9LECA|nr:MAG: hypothetical protein GOMPHAMPRED_004220 [Gomphillus americanus]